MQFHPTHCQPENFLSSTRTSLSRHSPATRLQISSLVESTAFHITKKRWGNYSDRWARDILGMLEEECRAAGVSIFLSTRIQEVSRTTEFVVRTAGETFQAPVVVVATGGLSIPKIGASSLGYDLARQFGLQIREPRPGLVPLVLSAEDRSHYCDLTGVSAEVIASCDGHQFREKMLITHAA
jgi:predicted flavoprotein YhiN